MDILDRVKAKVKVDPETGCWNWQGWKQSGYPVVRVRADNSRGFANQRLHRLVWEKYYGKIPPGLCVCHACDNPACVNPDHLMLGTQIANNIDCEKKGRRKNNRSHPKWAIEGAAVALAKTAIYRFGNR